MSIRPFVLFLAFSGACFCTNAFAQQAGREMLTTRDGLSQGFISCMLQDSEGFIWVSTKNGLNRYDGRHFQVFTKDPYDEFSLSNDFITCLAEYGDFLIVGTEQGGVNLFHKKTKKSYRLYCPLSVPGITLDKCYVAWVDVDAAGNLWVQAEIPHQPWEHWKIHRVTLPDSFWKNPPPDNAWQQQITVQVWPQLIYFAAYMSPDKKYFYAVDSSGIIKISTVSQNATVLLPPLPPGNVENSVEFCNDTQGRTWIVRNYHFSNQYFTDIYQDVPDAGESRSSTIRKIATQYPGTIDINNINRDHAWLRTSKGVKGYRIKKNGLIDLAEPDTIVIPVPEGYNYGITDRSGIVWIGTNGLGIIKFNPWSNRFKHLFPGESIYSPVLMDRHGDILAYSNTFKLLYKPGTPAWLTNELYNISNAGFAQDKQGNIWMAGRSMHTGQWILKKIVQGSGVQTFPLPYSGNQASMAMTVADNGDIWLAVDGFFIHFNQVTGQFLSFDFHRILPTPNNVFALAQTADKSWWLGTSAGLIKAKPSGDHFDFIGLKNEPSNRNSLRNNNVASLLTDPVDPGILWIGTKGGGLDRLDTRTLQFKHLTTREGLPDNVIYGVLAESGTSAGTVLWLSSNKGLIRYVPSDGTIKNYTEEDGLQANEFNTWAYGKSPAGDMLFGGVNGLTIFHPQQLTSDTFAPRTFITGLRLNDLDVSQNDSTGILTQSVEFTDEITIPFSRNNITLEFVALHFASPKKNRFRYYLEGAETVWAHESFEYTTSYINLAPGTYVFRVQGSNSEGVWSAQPAELTITVLPPWYRSWWAGLFYVLLIGGTVYWIYRYQLRRKLEHAENERLKELDHFKSQFFTNITHEFRTPLTVILGTAEQLTGNESKDTAGEIRFPRSKFLHQMTLIRRNGENLLRLINEILDLAKLESKSLKIHYIQGDILAYLRYISESLHSMANTRNVLLRVESNQAAIQMDYDPERILQIAHNLLWNAVKFTPSGGRVTLAANTRQSGPVQEQLVLTVTDTGVGIPAEDLPSIFDRFYQGKNQDQAKAGGTGIGLSLTRELVKAMGGDISVESTPGVKTVFTVVLPLTRKAAPGDWKDIWTATAETESTNMPLPVSQNGKNGADKPHLLIIEDNPDVVEYLAACLAGDYQLEHAYNGRAGIEKALELVPDIIVSDVMMPEKNGLEVCDTLKNDARTSHIPIVLLTAKATLSDRLAGLRRGADVYLAKPFHREELLVQLDRLLDNRQKMQTRYLGVSMSEIAPVDSTTETTLEDAFLIRLRTYLHEHISESQLSPDDISRAMGMGRTNLYNKLRALTGMPITIYLRTLRLHHSRELLLNPTMNVSEVAYAVGFDDPKYFSRIFSEEFGAPPSAMRG